MAQELPEFKAKTNQPLETKVPNVQAITGKMALSDTALGAFGAKVAQLGANNAASIMGYEMGQTPRGDLLPPITESDQAFQKAYSAQAEATLGTQAHKMLQDAQLDLASKPKLNNEDISAFETQMSQGLDSITRQAPSSIRPQLQQQFNNQMLQISGNLSMRKIKENRQETIDNFEANTKNQTEQLWNAYFSRNGVYGDSLIKSINENADTNFEQGLISQTRRDAIKKSAQLAKWSGIVSNESAEARNKNNLANYLSDLDNRRPDDVSPSDWEQVKQNAMSYNKGIDQQSSMDVQNRVTDALLEIAQNGTLSDQTLSSLQNNPNITRAQYNRVLLSQYTHQRQQSQKQQSINNVVQDWGSTDSLAINSATPQQLDEGYVALVSHRPGGLTWQNKMDVAAASSRPVPLFNRELKTRLYSPNGQDVFLAANAIQEFNQNNNMSALDLSSDDLALFNEFNTAFKTTNDLSEANKRARDIVVNVSDEVRQTRKKRYAEIKRDKYSEPRQIDNLRDQIFNKGFFQNYADPTEASKVAQDVFRQSMLLHDNNEKEALETAKLAVKQVSGTSNVNGINQIMMHPPEKAAGIDENASGVVQMDIVRQLSGKFDETKNAFNKGNSNFYYQFKNPEVWDQEKVLKQYFDALDKAQKFGPKSPADALEFADAQKRVQNLIKGAPLIVQRIHNDGSVEDLKLLIGNSSLMSLDVSRGNDLGPYGIFLQSDNKTPQNIANMGPDFSSTIRYNMDVKKVREDYVRLQTSLNNGRISDEDVKTYQNKKAQEEKIIKDNIRKSKASNILKAPEESLKAFKGE